MASRKRIRDIQVAERRTQAIRLRTEGKSWDEIARALGYSSRGAACQDVSRALAQRRQEQGEAADALLELELERLDALWAKAWEVLERPHLQVSGGRVVKVQAPDGREVTLRDEGPVLAAIRELARLVERRAKLLGLDSAVKVDAGVAVRLAEDQAVLMADVLREFARLRGLDLAAPDVAADARRAFAVIEGGRAG